MPDAWNLQTLGPPHAAPLILLHGFLGTGADEWLPIARRMQPGARCITLDLPGHGQHRLCAGDYRDFDHVTDTLAAVIQHQIGAPVRLLGYSLGGRIALHLALKHPQLISRLVLESASPGLRSPDERARRRREDETRAQGLEALGDDPAAFMRWLRGWYAQPIFSGLATRPDVLEQTLALRAMQRPAQLAAALRLLGAGAQPSLWEALPGLRMPALAVAGAQDVKFVAIAQEMAACCSALRLAVLPECSHNVHAEDPDRYTAAIHSFLAEA
jgi:2-succinyl-6-hydroxy-2,4-cyclohexadiene-1-carboxylate synthase